MDYTMYPFNTDKLSIAIIQGDSYTTTLSLYKNNTLIGPEIINKIYLTCKELDLNLRFTFNNESKKYQLIIPSEKTSTFAPGYYKFDITIFMINGQVFTKVHNGELIISKKINEVIDE